MKTTTSRMYKLIEDLNTLICEDSLLTRTEREDLVRAVAAIGAIKARVSMKKTASQESGKPPAEKKERIPDPRFPRAGEAWCEEEEILLQDALESVPDVEIGTHLFWLAEKLGRTPYSVACKIALLRHLPIEWKNQFQKISDDIRQSGLTVGEFVSKNGL